MVGIKRALCVLCAAAALSMASCDFGGGDEDLSPPPRTEAGALGRLAPPDTDLYFEAVVRPGDEMRDAIDGVIAAFGGEEDAGDAATELREEMLESFNHQLPLNDPDGPIDYESDIAPWLGDRIAGFATLPADLSDLAAADDPLDPARDEILDGAVVLSVTDAEAAESAIERLAGEQAVETPRASVYVPASEPLFDQDVALTDGAMIIGDPGAVDAALSASGGANLTDETWFGDGLAEISDKSLGFFLAPSEDLFRAQMAREAPRLADRFGEEIIKRLGYDRSAPVALEALVEDDAVALDTAYGLERAAPLDAATKLARRLPADAFLGFSDPAILPALIREFTLGVEIGLRKQGQTVIRRLGYDPALALNSLTSPVAIFASGDSPADLLVGVSVSSVTPIGVTHPIDGARFTLGAAYGASLIKPLGANPYEFTAEFDGLPGAIDVTEDANTVNAVLGPTPEARKAALPGHHDACANREWQAIRDRLGDGYSPLGFVEIGPTLELLSGIPGLIPPEAGSLPDEVENLRVDFGGRTEGKTFTLRYLLSNQD